MIPALDESLSKSAIVRHAAGSLHRTRVYAVTTPTAKTIQIYLPTGEPSGIRIAEITTRTLTQQRLKLCNGCLWFGGQYGAISADQGRSIDTTDDTAEPESHEKSPARRELTGPSATPLGLEPRMAGPKPAVLPITPRGSELEW